MYSSDIQNSLPGGKRRRNLGVEGIDFHLVAENRKCTEGLTVQGLSPEDDTEASKCFDQIISNKNFRGPCLKA